MNSDLACALLGVAVGVPLAIWPGPVLARTIRSVPVYGAGAGVRAAGGRFLADFLMIALLGALVLLSVPILDAMGTAIGVLGGLVLAGLGFQLMDRWVAGSLAREQAKGDLPIRYGNPVMDRVATTVASPLWHLFWWTAGLRMVTLASGRSVTGVGALAAGLLLPGLLWPTFVAIRLARGERETALADRQVRILTSLGGLILVAVGFYLGSEALAGSGVRSALARGAAAIFGGETQ